MKSFKYFIFIICLGLISLFYQASSAAQVKQQPAQIAFDSFTGIYHLSRDSRGLSLLTSEETILADFPGNGSFYGITRTIPKKYQNSSVNVKVLNITDAAGSTVPYKTSTDKEGNLLITTGDPKITLYGSQTIKIRYQTSGVVNLRKNSDEFLLNVNGRGWNQGFSAVYATVDIPAVFHASLKSDPVCYMALNNSSSNNCQIITKKSPQETVVNSQTKNLQPHQALVLKFDFKSSTFTNNQGMSVKFLAVCTASLLSIGSLCAYKYGSKYSKKR